MFFSLLKQYQSRTAEIEKICELCFDVGIGYSVANTMDYDKYYEEVLEKEHIRFANWLLDHSINIEEEINTYNKKHNRGLNMRDASFEVLLHYWSQWG